MNRHIRINFKRVLPLVFLVFYVGTNVTTAFADSNPADCTLTAAGTPCANQKALLEGGVLYTNLSQDTTCSVDTTSVSSGPSETYASAQVQAFAREPITSTWNISDSTVEQWFLKQDTAQAVISKYGLTSSNIGQITSAVTAANVSPVYFYLYAVEEGGGLGGFINHYSSDAPGGGPANATRDAEYIASQAQKTGDDPAWIDVDNYKDFVPADIKASGDADFKSMPVGTIGRIYIPATAAAAWEVYYPAGLKASVNGVQDYGPPLEGVMQNITRIGGDPLDGGVSVGGSSGSCTTDAAGVAGAGMTKAINFAVMIANNDGYGYDNSDNGDGVSGRWSGWAKWQSDPSCTKACGSFDCSALVAAALTEAGYFTKIPMMFTGNEADTLAGVGFKKVASSAPSSAGLQAGDIVFYAATDHGSSSGHTAIYIGNNQLVEASSEFGHPEVGDQDTSHGGEIHVRNFYDDSWTNVYRAPS